MKKILSMLALLYFASGASAEKPLLSGNATPGQAGTAAGSEHRLAIKKISFLKNPTIWLPDYKAPPPEGLCDHFKLTEADVRDYFAKAHVVDHDSVKGYSIEPCWARGRMVLKNGKKATWVMTARRVAFVRFSNDTKLTFICPDCQSEKFRETCGVECLPPTGDRRDNTDQNQ